MLTYHLFIAQVRKEYLYDLKQHKGESLECVVFGITSISGMAILFNIMLTNGACYWRLPISAFFQKSYDRAQVPDMSVDELELWNCFSYYPSVHHYSYLTNQRGKFLGKDKKFYKGEYLFTIDWAHPDSNIWILTTLRYLKNISVHIYWNSITVILQLSLIIVFCGTFLTILLISFGLTLKSKILTGLSKIKTGLQKILTRCSIR